MYSGFVFVFFTLSVSLCQDLTFVEQSEVPTPVICQKCLCADGIVDCNFRDLTGPFSEEEWKELGASNIVVPNEVWLAGNSLRSLGVIPELPVKVLNVSNSKIDNLEDVCLGDLPDLEVLDLSRNRLISLSRRAFWGRLMPDSKFRSFVKMKYLSIAYNELHSLPKDTFGFMHELTFLDISGNPLKIIDQVVMGTLSDLTYLEELRMSECELETLPEGLLRRQRRLKRLDISNNKFKAIPSVLNEAVNLVYLNFDRNQITTLEEETSLSSLTKLQELSMCRNTRLTRIGPHAMGGLESLVSLSICNNPRLSRLDDDFLTWIDEDDIERRPLLQELYLHNNNITEIDSDFLFRWDQLKKMDFSNNPYICDCTNQWMVDVLVPFMIANNASANDMICKSPQDMRGLSFSQLFLNNKVLTCPALQDVQETASANTAIVLGVIIGTFATFPLVLVVVLLWKRGYFAKCRSKMRNEEDSEEEDGPGPTARL